MRAIATSLLHPDVAYVSYDHLSLDGKNWIGVAKTTNSGGEWKLTWKEPRPPANNMHDAWITERFGRLGRESLGDDRGRAGSQPRLRN